MTDRQTRRATALVALIAAFSAAGCAAAGPGSGENRIRIVDPTGQLRDHGPLIDSLARATLQTVERAIDVRNVTITIRSDPANAIGGWGVGGFTPDAETVSIALDPSFPELGRLLPARLPPLLAHELHHSVRHRQPGYGGTLFEAMISEGLADRFAIELLQAPVPPWSAALDDSAIERWYSAAEPEFDRAGYDHARWFFGSTSEVPRWTGYAIGYHLVAAYQAGHPGATAAALVATSAAAFRP